MKISIPAKSQQSKHKLWQQRVCVDFQSQAIFLNMLTCLLCHIPVVLNLVHRSFSDLLGCLGTFV